VPGPALGALCPRVTADWPASGVLGGGKEKDTLPKGTHSPLQTSEGALRTHVTAIVISIKSKSPNPDQELETQRESVRELESAGVSVVAVAGRDPVMTGNAIRRDGGIDDLQAESDGDDQIRYVLPVKHIQ